MGGAGMTDPWQLLRLQVLRAVGRPAADVLDSALLDQLAARVDRVREKVLGHAPTRAYLEDPLDRAAYAAVMAPRTLAAVLATAPATAPGARILDLGCGTGAASFVFAARGAGRIHLVDHGGTALRDAATTLSTVNGLDVRTTEARIAVEHSPSLAGLYDVVVLAFSLLEIAQDNADGAARLLGWATRMVNPTGTLLLVDSAQPERARILNGLRGPLRELGFHVHAPCPHDGACPALERPRDFCHAATAWELPEDFRRAGELANLHRDRVTYTFLRAGRAPVEKLAQLLVIGDVQREKGRARVAVCGEGPVRELVALQRHRAAFDAMLATERGTRLRPVHGEDRLCRVEDPAVLEPLP